MRVAAFLVAAIAVLPIQVLTRREKAGEGSTPSRAISSRIQARASFRSCVRAAGSAGESLALPSPAAAAAATASRE
jgi:hypothetical protein